MARFEITFKEFGRVIVRARGGRPESVQASMNEKLDKKYNGGKNVRKTTKRR